MNIVSFIVTVVFVGAGAIAVLLLRLLCGMPFWLAMLVGLPSSWITVMLLMILLARRRRKE